MGKKTSKTPTLDRAEAKAAIIAAIHEAKEPLKAPQIAKLTGMPKGLTGALVKELLAESDSSEIFNWGTAKTPAWWRRDQQSEVRERLLSISAAEVLPAAQLTARAAKGPPKIAATLVKKAQQGLIKEKFLREDDKKLVNFRHAEPWLESKIAALLKDWGREIPSVRIRALFADAPAAEPANESVGEVADKLFAAMNRIALVSGTTVTFHRLRQQPELARIPKATFDAAALLLQTQRKALLSVHDHASTLLPEEREQFVTNGSGTYYVSLYAR